MKGKREYDLNVDGMGKVHVREETDGKFIIEVPNTFLLKNLPPRPPVTSEEYEEFLRTSCAHDCPPQNCPKRIEAWIFAHDPEKTPRDLSFLKARLQAQCVKNHPKLDEEDVRIVTQLKRRQGRCPVKKK